LEEPRFCEAVTSSDAREKRKLFPCVLRESSRLEISSPADGAWGDSPFCRKYFISSRTGTCIEILDIGSRLSLSSILLPTELRFVNSAHVVFSSKYFLIILSCKLMNEIPVFGTGGSEPCRAATNFQLAGVPTEQSSLH
jgi:hypothetical protein